MSMPITLLISRLHSVPTEAVGDTTPTDSRSRRNRASRRGGQLLTRARSSSSRSACPHFRAPGASVPDGRTIRGRLDARSGEFSADNSHTGYECDRGLERQAAARRAGQRPFPQRRGGDQAHLSRSCARSTRNGKCRRANGPRQKPSSPSCSANASSEPDETRPRDKFLTVPSI